MKSISKIGKIVAFASLLLIVGLAGCTNTNQNSNTNVATTCARMNRGAGVEAQLTNPQVLYPDDSMPLEFTIKNAGEYSTKVKYRINVDSMFEPKNTEGEKFLNKADFDATAGYYYPFEEYISADIHVPDNVEISSLKYVLEYLYNYTTEANIVLCLGAPDEAVRVQNRLCSPSEQPKICQTGSPLYISSVEYYPAKDRATILIKFATIPAANILDSSISDIDSAQDAIGKTRSIKYEVSVDGNNNEISCSPDEIKIYPNGQITPLRCTIYYDKLGMQESQVNMGSLKTFTVKIPEYEVYATYVGEIPIQVV